MKTLRIENGPEVCPSAVVAVMPVQAEDMRWGFSVLTVGGHEILVLRDTQEEAEAERERFARLWRTEGRNG